MKQNMKRDRKQNFANVSIEMHHIEGKMAQTLEASTIYNSFPEH